MSSRPKSSDPSPVVPPFESEVTVRAKPEQLPAVLFDAPKRIIDPSGRVVDHGEIGCGGMGSVHRVEDQHIERYAALKLPHPHLRESMEAMRRFVREARVLGRLDHPNVVPLYDLALDHEGLPVHFMMKLVQGETLHHRVSSRKDVPRSEEELRDLLQALVKVCDAIAFAHEQGILHRDLKPENVMLGSHGQVYVMDWGIAGVRGIAERQSDDRAPPSSLESGAGTTTAILGTPQYMAPEQAWGDPTKIGPRTDVFALGALLYFILTGKAPHRAQSAAEAWALARTSDVKPPTEVAPTADIPPKLAQIAMRALAKNPDDRYPSAVAFKADLEKFLRSGLWFSTRNFAAGTVILHEGEVGEHAFIIVSGECEAFRDEGGQHVRLRTMGPGDVFGEMAILTEGRRTASVRALTDVTAMVVSRASLERELGEDSWLAALVRTLASRFRELEERVGSP